MYYVLIYAVDMLINHRVQAKSFDVGDWTFVLEFKSRRRPKTPRSDAEKKIESYFWEENISKIFMGYKGNVMNFGGASFTAQKCVPTSKNTPWLNEKVFLGHSSEFWLPSFSDEKCVPTSKNTPWLNEKVFSDHNSEN